MSNTQAFEIGSTVVFTGFTSDELPENSDLLEEGETYVIAETKQEGDDAEVAYLLEVENPNFDTKKRASKSNPKTLKIDVFSDEIKLSDVTEDEEEEEDEDEVEVEAEESEMTALEFADIKKGMEVSAYDGDELIVAGTVVSKTKKAIKIEDAEGDEVTVSADATIYEGLFEAEAEMEEEAAGEDPELKGMLILSEEEEDEDILTLVNESEDLCGLAQEMSEESASLDYRLGGVLYHVRLSGAYKDLDESYVTKGGFMKYIEEQLPVGYRKAMYLIDIYTKWRKYDLDVEKVQQIGWTKAQEIARVMTAENAEELVKLAEDSTVSDLKETIKESYTGGSKEREAVKKITFKFRLTEDAGANVREFFEQAKAEMGLERDEEVFEQIVTQWATDHLSVKKVGRASTKKAEAEEEAPVKAKAKAPAKKTAAKKKAA
jgi:RNase P/RNase MRP subunit p29